MVNSQMLRVLIFVLLSIGITQAWDIRTISCYKANYNHNYPYNLKGQWDCWYNQTCGRNPYECNGITNDAPPFPPLEFTFIIVGLVAVLLIVILLLVCCCFLKRRSKCCY